jgi:hypothetical protein
MENKTENELIEAFYVAQGGKPSNAADIDFYQSDWNMLMSVVEKIEQMKVPEDSRLGYEFTVKIQHNECVIESHTIPTGMDFVSFRDSSFRKIDSTYQAIVIFIKWYNSTKVVKEV